MNLKVVGAPAPRIEGAEKVGGTTVYTADVNLPGMLWGRCLRSPYAHARILGINADKAKKVKGVFAVLTGNDLPPHRVGLSLQDTPVLAQGKVRFMGEKVAAVAAESLDAADEALSLIEVSYEELPAIFDVVKAMAAGAPLVHEELPSYKGFHAPPEALPNVFAIQNWTAGDVEAGFKRADLVLEHTFTTGLAHQAYIEPHSVVVAVNGAGSVDIWASCKAPFRVKSHLSRQLEIPKERIRVHVVAVGGDFGGKGALMDIPICYELAKTAKRPVKMIMTYHEELIAGDPRHASMIRIKSGVKKDGTIVARTADVIFNSGAYASFKPGEVPNLGGGTHATGVYRIPNYAIRSYGVYTNGVPCGYYRAPGQPQTVFAAESHTDLLAKALGLDALDFRLKNLIRDGDKLPGGRGVDKVRCRETLLAAAKKAGWGKRRGAGAGLGIGVSFRHVGGSGLANAEITALPDGKVTILTAVPDIGTGTHTLLGQIAAEVLTIPAADIRAEIGDTETFENDAAPGGSKITNMSGHAVLLAAEALREQLTTTAAAMLGCQPAEVKLAQGRFSYGKKNSLRFAEVCRRAVGGDGLLRIRKSYEVKGRSPVAAFVAQIAEVEVDRETGRMRVKKMITAHDVGTVINPLTHQGQIEGGLVQGLGYAVMEEVVTENGKVLTANFGDYRIPAIADIPALETVLIEDANGPGPFAAKQIGENGIVATAAAVANALDAAAGVRIFDLPVTAEKIYFALKAQKPAA
ncbi:MAG TPA: xanthine dehydrogenase family protein molybdopterin-binding subunit [Verrucomicrobiae bacterium]|nr:xanthine dehydrogenase family protein molybdopterin-binding subunit [Verrucomicrobiae bacterium]